MQNRSKYRAVVACAAILLSLALPSATPVSALSASSGPRLPRGARRQETPSPPTGTADASAETVGVPWTGEMGVTEPVADLMAKDEAAKRDRRRPRRSETEIEPRIP